MYQMGFSYSKAASLKPKKEKYLLTFILAIITSAAFLVPYMIDGEGYFTFYGDFNVQQIPFYQLCHKAIKEGNIAWNWNTDLGANFIGSYSFYLLGSPFFWLTIPFSNSSITGFKYDSATGKYERNFKGTVNKDYVTGETTQVKNVFVLLTSIGNYADGYHKNISLQGGDGYYFANGTYTPIKWQKGAAKNAIKFTNTDGTTLTVNQGNSWVCITNKSNKITIK